MYGRDKRRHVLSNIIQIILFTTGTGIMNLQPDRVNHEDQTIIITIIRISGLLWNLSGANPNCEEGNDDGLQPVNI